MPVRRTVGCRAESAVAEHLRHHGYVILDRNVRVGRFEIDLLVQHQDVVAIVEVRFRGPTSWQDALESVSHAKMARLLAAADRLWLARFQNDPSVNRLRFDLAAVRQESDGTWRIEHVPGAFA
jgi:putative endonuclease